MLRLRRWRGSQAESRLSVPGDFAIEALRVMLRLMSDKREREDPKDSAEGPKRAVLTRLSVHETLYVVLFIASLLWIGYKVSWLLSLVAIGALIALYLLLLPEIETTRAAAHFFRSPIVIVVWFGTFVFLDGRFQPQTTEFFGLAAQVIPVLLLAFILEARAFRHFYDKGDLAYAVFVSAIVGYGEFVALRAVAEDKASSGAGAIAAATIAAGSPAF
jgi:hypothetical protein